MKERCVNCSCLSVAIVIVAFLCNPTEQRPRCVLPADCAENLLEFGVFNLRNPGTKLLPDVDDPTAIKQLMEMLLKQHNEYSEAYRIDHDEEENSTESSPPENEKIHQLDAVQNPIPYIQIEADTTELPSSFVNSTNKMLNESSNTNTEKSKFHPISMKSNKTTNGDNDSFWEVTTIEPFQLASPFLIHEYHLKTTTIPPKPIQETTQNGHVNLTNRIPFNSTNLNNTPPNIVNIPPTKIDYMRNINRTTTLSPYVILGPQQLETIINNPTSSFLSLESLEKTKTKSTVKPQSDEKISSLFQANQKQKLKQDHQQEQEQHHHQNVGGGIQLETLNRSISTSKLFNTSSPAALVVGGIKEATAPVKEIATNTRPGKNPIHVIPESIVKQEYQVSVTPAAGIGNKPSVSPSGGKRPNPIPNSVASSESEAEDYLISQLASIVSGGEETDDDDEEENGEKGNEGNSSDDEEGEYLTDSVEENEERENFDYLDSGDASDVISSVIEEVGSLI